MIGKKTLDLGIEVICPHNDGWSKQGAKEKLEDRLKVLESSGQGINEKEVKPKTLTPSEAEEVIFIHRILALCDQSSP